jgi:hypothetical protein
MQTAESGSVGAKNSLSEFMSREDRNITLHMRDVNHFFGWAIRSLRSHAAAAFKVGQGKKRPLRPLRPALLHAGFTYKQSQREIQ